MPKHRDTNVRLAYSTGGEQPEREEPELSVSADGKSGIRIRLDRRGSGRVVTVVTGFPGTEAAAAGLARELKSACGAGGTYKDGAMELQGDHRGRVEAALRQRGLKSKRAGG
jgi:translation initiation factor 1